MRLGQFELEAVSSAFAGMTGTGWIRANCPLCPDRTGKEDKRESLGLNTDTGNFICHKCGSIGHLDEYGDSDPYIFDREPVAEEENPIEYCRGYISLAGPAKDSLSCREAYEYLVGRGVSDRTIVEANIGVVVDGYLGGRVVVPHILDHSENPWNGWIGRDYTGLNKDLPYRYSKGLKRDHLWHESILTKDRKFVVALDGDSWEEGLSFVYKLMFYDIRAGFVRLPGGEDPGSVDPDWLIAEATKSCNCKDREEDPIILVEGVFDALPYYPNSCAFLGKPTDTHFERLLFLFGLG